MTLQPSSVRYTPLDKKGKGNDVSNRDVSRLGEKDSMAQGIQGQRRILAMGKMLLEANNLPDQILIVSED